MGIVKWETRTQWGARAPRAPLSGNVDPVDGVTIHYGGQGPFATDDHEGCRALFRAWQRMHQADRQENYVDLAYNLGACHHGIVMEGRSTKDRPKVRSGANGTSRANGRSMAVVALWGLSDGQPPAALLDALAYAVGFLRAEAGAARDVRGHRDWSQTSCPGPYIYARRARIYDLAAGYPAAFQPQEDDVRREYADTRTLQRRTLPRGKEVVLGELDARAYKGQALLFLAQLAFDTGRGPTRAKRVRLRFVRVKGEDGTGEGDYIATPRRWRTVHMHAFMGGDRVQVRATWHGKGKAPVLRYGHLKAIRFA